MTLLTGFRVDMVGETRQYEVRPSMAIKGDVLKFRCSKEGDMELLPTEFATRLSPQIETYLQARSTHRYHGASASASAARTSVLTSAGLLAGAPLHPGLPRIGHAPPPRLVILVSPHTPRAAKRQWRAAPAGGGGRGGGGLSLRGGYSLARARRRTMYCSRRWEDPRCAHRAPTTRSVCDTSCVAQH